MEMTRERISVTFDPSREMLLPHQLGFSFVRTAAVACEILERLSGLEASSETTAPRYLQLVTVPGFCLTFLTEDWLQISFWKLNAIQYCVVTTTLMLVQF